MSTNKLDNKYLALMRKFPLIPIKNKHCFHEAITLMKELTVPVRLTSLTESENDYLDILSDLIAKYEKQNWQPLAKPMTPAETLQYLLEQSGITQSALASQTGVRQSHISEFLSGARDLSKASLVKITNFFRVSPELFLPQQIYSSYEISRQHSGRFSLREDNAHTNNTESVVVQLPNKLVDRLKTLAQKKKTSKQMLISELLNKYIDLEFSSDQ